MKSIIAFLKALWAFIKELFKSKKQSKKEFIDETIKIFSTLMQSEDLDSATGYVVTQVRKTNDREGIVIICKKPNVIDRGMVIYVRAIVDGGPMTKEKFPFCIPLIFPFIGDPLQEIQKRALKLAEDLNVKQTDGDAMPDYELEHREGDGPWKKA